MFPVLTRKYCGSGQEALRPFLLHGEMKSIQISLAQPAAFNAEQPCSLELLHPSVDTSLGTANIFSESFLSRKTATVIPGILEKHRVRDLRSHTELCIFKNKIWNLREAPAKYWALRREFDVSFDRLKVFT